LQQFKDSNFGMKNILVPVGSSKSAVSNLQYAIDLAKEVDANVYVISVFKQVSKVGGLTKLNEIMKEDSKNRIAEVMAAVDTKGVTVVAHPIKGDVLDGVKRFNKHVPVDLMVISPRSNSIRDEVFLGKTSGKLVKSTSVPVLVVPEGVVFEKPKTVMMAFKNGQFKKNKTLEPLVYLTKKFNLEVNLLHVETPESTKEMLGVSKKLMKIKKSYTKTDNASTFLGVVEYFQQMNPDIVCVVRRQRGFFSKLWEKNIILKKEFYTSKPLLVLGVQDY
jgi:nucleotide-binding universal stress UspA family protein